MFRDFLRWIDLDGVKRLTFAAFALLIAGGVGGGIYCLLEKELAPCIQTVDAAKDLHLLVVANTTVSRFSTQQACEQVITDMHRHNASIDASCIKVK